MTLVQLTFFALSAGALAGGLLLVLKGLRIRFPRWFGAAHGLWNLSGIVLLFAANLVDGQSVSAARWWALGIFVTALSGGLVLCRALFQGRVPVAAAGLHGLMACFGLYLLAPAAGFGNSGHAMAGRLVEAPFQLLECRSK